MSEASLFSQQPPSLSFLAYGPLKFRGVMQTLLGRKIELTDRRTVFRGGYELVIVDPTVISEEGILPEYALHPKDYGVVALACYSNLKPDDIALINKFLRVGEVTDARAEPAELVGYGARDLIHHLKPGISFTPIDFGSKKNHDPIFKEVELNELQPVRYLARARDIRAEFGVSQANQEGSSLALQSRK